MMPLLQAKAIEKRFYTPSEIIVLSSIDLSVEKGETLAIMGKSGEGKSTLLHILGTLDRATQGELFIANQKVNESCSPKIRLQHIGFIFQAFNLFEEYTALDNVLFPAKIARKKTAPNDAAYQRAMQLLSSVALASRAHYPVKLLSGGERQRVAIARALINDPTLLLADEPSGNLDAKTSDEIHSLLLHLVESEKKALIVVTHDHNLASLCQKKYTLERGSLS